MPPQKRSLKGEKNYTTEAGTQILLMTICALHDGNCNNNILKNIKRETLSSCVSHLTWSSLAIQQVTGSWRNELQSTIRCSKRCLISQTNVTH